MSIRQAIVRFLRAPAHRRRLAELTQLLENARWREAQPLAEEALIEAEAIFGEDDPETIPLRYALASCALALDQLDDARRRSEEAVALAKVDPSASDPPLPQLLEQLAAIHDHRGDDEALEGLLRDVVASFRRMREPDPDDRALAENRLALHLARHERRDEARSHFAAAIDVAREAGLPQLALYLHNAASFRTEDAADEAEAWFVEAQALTDDPALRPKIAHNLATLRAGQGELEAAEAGFGDALDGFVAEHGDEAPELRPTLVQRARLRHAAGRFEDAADDYERALRLAETHLGEDDPITAQLRVWLGDAHSHTFR